MHTDRCRPPDSGLSLLLLGRDEALNWRAASHSLAFLFWWRYLVTLLCSHTLYSSRLRTVSAIVLSNNLIG
ncbi:MAG: hypothetical protein WBG31_08865 [Marinomonas sp.]